MLRIRSAGWVLAAQVCVLGLGFPLSVLLARMLGPDGKGLVSLTQLVASVGAVIANLGLPTSVNYLAARNRATAPSVVKLALGTSISAVVVALALWSTLRSFLGVRFADGDSRLVVLGIVAILPLLVSGFMASFLTGVGRVRSSAQLNVLPVLLQLTACSALALWGRLTVATALGSWFVAISVTAFVAVFVGLTATRPASDRGPLGILKSGLAFGVMSWVASGLGFLVLRSDMLLLARLAGTKEVGIYSVAVVFAELLFYVPTALITVLMPKVASGIDDAQALVARITRVLWPSITVLAATIGAAAVLVVPTAFGESFRSAVPATWLLIPGAIASAVAGPAAAYFMGEGRPQVVVLANGMNLALNIACNLVLIPLYDINGAAIASSVSYAVGAAVLLVRLSRVAGVPGLKLMVPSVLDYKAMIGALRNAAREHGF